MRLAPLGWSTCRRPLLHALADKSYPVVFRFRVRALTHETIPAIKTAFEAIGDIVPGSFTQIKAIIPNQDLVFHNLFRPGSVATFHVVNKQVIFKS